MTEHYEPSGNRRRRWQTDPAIQFLIGLAFGLAAGVCITLGLVL